MKNEIPPDVYVLSARDGGRIMAMLYAITSALEEVLEARKQPFDEVEEIDESELLFDEAEAGLLKDDDLTKIF